MKGLSCLEHASNPAIQAGLSFPLRKPRVLLCVRSAWLRGNGLLLWSSPASPAAVYTVMHPRKCFTVSPPPGESLATSLTSSHQGLTFIRASVKLRDSHDDGKTESLLSVPSIRAANSQPANPESTAPQLQSPPRAGRDTGCVCPQQPKQTWAVPGAGLSKS